MKVMPCPNCSADTTKAAAKPYCSQCGWNIPAAEEAIRIQGAACFLVIGIFGALLMRAAAFSKSWLWVIVVSVLILAGIFLTNYYGRVLPLRQFATLRKTLSIPRQTKKPWVNVQFHTEVRRNESGYVPKQPLTVKRRFAFRINVGKPKISAATTAEEETEPASAQLNSAKEEVRLLSALPRPRAVRMTRNAILSTALAGPALIAFDIMFWSLVGKQFAANGSISTLIQKNWLALMVAVAMPVAGAQYIRRLFRDRKLLSAGEVALGIVRKQTTGSKTGSTIEYFFQTTDLAPPGVWDVTAPDGITKECRSPFFTITMTRTRMLPGFVLCTRLRRRGRQ
jgi:hypothetical protein